MRINNRLTYPSQTDVKKLFSYDDIAAALRWNIRDVSSGVSKRNLKSWNIKHAGKLAGHQDNQGYAKICLNKQVYSAHRLIWILHFGEIPEGLEIDHIDGNRSNNRPENLRLVTHSENCKNSRKLRPTGELKSGVHWHASRQKWRARVGYNMQRMHLGFYDDRAEAERIVAVVKRALGFTERAVA